MCYDVQRNLLCILLLCGGTSALANEGSERPLSVGGSIGDDGGGPISYFYTATKSPSIDGSAPEPLPEDDASEQDSTYWDLTLLEGSLDDAVEVLITLRDPEFDFRSFQEAPPDVVAGLVQQRTDQLAPLYSEVYSQLSALWGDVAFVTEYWLTPTLVAHVPRRVILEQFGADVPKVLGIHYNQAAEVTSSYGGNETRNGTRANILIVNGYTGACCGRSGGRVRLAVIDQGRVYQTHPAWDDVASSPVGASTRLAGSYNCDSGTCWVLATSPPPSAETHGFRVTWMAVASLEEGQDPALTSSTVRRHHSGVAREAAFLYYHASHTGAASAALQHAVVNGVDIVNYSQSLVMSPRCAPANDSAGMNTAIKNALDAGVLMIAGADNVYGRPACTLGYPAQRSEVVTVGALQTLPQTLDYNDTMMWEEPTLQGSSYGGIPAKLVGGATATLAGVDLVAPSIRTGIGSSTWYWYDSTDFTGGTSYATPVVAGTAALLVDGLESAGWSASDKRSLKAQLLLLGDHWNAESNSKERVGLSKWSGAGRLRAHAPSTGDLTSPWGWGWRTVLVQNGDVIEWPVGSPSAESCSITQWKWATMWTEFNLNAVANINFRVIDKCPVGGGPDVEVAADMGLDIVSKFSLRTSDICGKCLYMQAIGASVPAGGRNVYSADYFHSGSTAIH